MVCPLRNCCTSHTSTENLPMEETSPLVEAIVQAVQTCLTVAKHTENAKVYNQKRKRYHQTGCWRQLKKLLCCCCPKEKPVSGSITALSLWMQSHIPTRGLLVVGYAVYSSGVRWEAILEGETLSPGDRAQLDACLESAQVRLAGLMLNYWDGDFPGYGTSGGRFSPRMQEDIIARFRDKVGICELTDAVALKHFCRRT
ncbi:hypothetical protein FTN76_01475 [Chlamydia trachomatis]|uniref:Uncharacterized protein n=1 Tax=Chlamydia trachomatis serovar L2 (strain ATCC VR-902B / DSM 19102 / 434/Bu) TaxID=471472 RepID=A0A0H3MBH5_CHLT2|nr:hypothetical protein CTLINITIAL_01335 [Chlamydia trachomatis L2/434/Bu(i)]AGJ65287.1 hypothetical protein CTLFINAL_01335 [Chlamydia trachomatis L2/434/Bu(f)]AGR94333.1 hypothetical protein CTRC69_04710 [Chlamydia trachomatis RC-F/69]AGR95258.1 hypothetical protein CTRC46_04690 [Chlamydia trachomatis RC-L2(s)/46]AGR97138.1 hypothetical protein CTRC943_04680 [Chlamydia trachomatis RC-J/943]AGR98058.1 hypothetical protein CTRC953_04665 [Chlamydia trachomatis RC-J/953]AGR98977.1 hypothetical p